MISVRCWEKLLPRDEERMLLSDGGRTSLLSQDARDKGRLSETALHMVAVVGLDTPGLFMFSLDGKDVMIRGRRWKDEELCVINGLTGL